MRVGFSFPTAAGHLVELTLETPALFGAKQVQGFFYVQTLDGDERWKRAFVALLRFHRLPPEVEFSTRS